MFRTQAIRTAVATAQTLARLDGVYPTYTHKWTGMSRCYSAADLRLPAGLHLKGKSLCGDRPIVAIGGTRSPIVETFCLVSSVIRELASCGWQVMSGGVPGVDLAAHLAAVEAPAGSTYAVLANPVEHGLAGHEWSNPLLEERMMRTGGFLSEYDQAVELDSDEFRERLLMRDRIISGLCDIFLAFECSDTSATVDTAKRALLQGKKVFCVSAAKASNRRGLDRLRAELALPMLSEATMSSREIALHVQAALGA